MPQLFSREAKDKARVIMLVIIVASLAGSVLLYLYASVRERHVPAPEQPVPFSHQHHVAELGIGCRYCHSDYDRSPFAGMPDTHTCMTCHSQVWTSAKVLEPLRQSEKGQSEKGQSEKGQSEKEGKPLRWRRVHRLPDYVYFDHSAHTNNGVGCESCHGRVDRMHRLRQVSSLSMSWCLDCHRDPAPHLRTPAQITAMGLKDRDSDQAKTLLDHFGINRERMQDCSLCHR